MKCLLPFLGFLTITVNMSEAEIDRLYAVSFFFKYDDHLYLETRNTKKDFNTDLTDLNSKIRICHYIALGMNHVEEKQPVYLNESYDELRVDFPHIFKMLYEKPTPDRNKESVFVCPIRDARTKDIEPYYISQEYNMSATRENYLAGRFIFIPDYETDQFRPYAIAEEAAKVLSEPYYNAERIYLQRRETSKPVKNQSEDPICKLNKEQRLRLCTLVNRSPYFDGDKKFFGLEDSVDKSMCFLLSIRFRSQSVKEEVEAKNLYYSEWVISCGNYRVISRAYKPNEVFIYRYGNSLNELWIENLSTDIGRLGLPSELSLESEK